MLEFSRMLSSAMKPITRAVAHCGGFAAAALQCSLMLAGVGPAAAAGCSFAPQGEGRVAEVIDARSFRLQDGREVRLAGIEPTVTEAPTAKRGAALAALILGHEVTLQGEDDTPDRYGRQPAFVFLEGVDIPVQSLLLAQGDALLSGTVMDKDCSSTLTAAETAGRQARRGAWADPTAIKNTESPGDILARIGRFTVVEGKVLSVRQAGATTYLNFGRNWTRDFAVTIPKRGLAAFEAAGMVLTSLEGRRIRVRGWVEAHGGPRIEALRVGQIELLGRN
jgi:endonuclease YncB( thermonuclease family)